MSARILMDSFPNTYYNLSLQALSLHDGLELLRHARRVPKVVLLEFNTASLGPNPAFLHDVLYSVLARAKPYLSPLREKYQPIGVVKALLRDGLDQRPRRLSEMPGAAPVPKPIFEAARSAVIRNFSIPDEELRLRSCFDSLYQHVAVLKQRGVAVIFYEVPVGAYVQRLPKAVRIRQFDQWYFPRILFKHILLPAETYQTTDGIHLPPQEAARYTHYLKTQLRTLRTHSNLGQTQYVYSASPSAENKPR